MQITVFDEQKQEILFDLKTLDAYSEVFCTAHDAFHCKPGFFAEKHIRSVSDRTPRRGSISGANL